MSACHRLAIYFGAKCTHIFWHMRKTCPEYYLFFFRGTWKVGICHICFCCSIPVVRRHKDESATRLTQILSSMPHRIKIGLIGLSPFDEFIIFQFVSYYFKLDIVLQLAAACDGDVMSSFVGSTNSSSHGESHLRKLVTINANDPRSTLGYFIGHKTSREFVLCIKSIVKLDLT